MDIFQNARLKYLSHNTSEHTPMLLSLESPLVNYGFPLFKFQQMWVSHDSFLDCVSQAWGGKVVGGSALVNIMIKLKWLKVALRDWNKIVFGQTEVRIENLQDRINELEQELQEGYLEYIEADLVASQVELSVWMDREEQRLSQ